MIVSDHILMWSSYVLNGLSSLTKLSASDDYHACFTIFFNLFYEQNRIDDQFHGDVKELPECNIIIG